MYGFIIGIIIFISVLLVLIVLVQNPKGGGLASTFSASNQFMGVKRTADFVEKATWGLAAGAIFLSVIATMIPHGQGGAAQSRIQRQIEENTAVDPGERLPAYPTMPADDREGETEE